MFSKNVQTKELIDSSSGVPSLLLIFEQKNKDPRSSPGIQAKQGLQDAKPIGGSLT